MALESFYGGKPGVSPVIKARFKYIDTNDLAYQARNAHSTILTKEEAIRLNDFYNQNGYREGDSITWNPNTLKPFTMEECFKDPEYKDVWYEELCIIDTDSKTNTNNGKLFKRTLATSNNSSLHAEYLGQIVGPSGGIPNIEIGSLDDIRKKAAGRNNNGDYENIDNWEYVYPTNLNDNIVITRDSVKDDENREDDFQKIAVLESNSSMTIPGKQIENNQITYNDNIKYTWCNIKKFNGDDEDLAWIYLGFQFPAPFFDITATDINYSSNETNLVTHTNKEGNDTQNHPFYHNLEFKIPRGTRGIGLEEIFILNKDKWLADFKNKINIYKISAIHYNVETDLYSIVETYNETSTIWLDKNETNDININNLSCWVGKWNLFNPKTSDIISVYVYLANYKDISNIELNENITNSNFGKLTITYSDGTTTTITAPLIKSVSLNTTLNDSNYGQFTIISSNNNTLLDTKIPLIKSMDINDTTKEITYLLNIDNINSKRQLQTGGFFLNLIEESYIDKRGHLLVLYGSSEYRPADNTSSDSSNGLYDFYTGNSYNGKIQNQKWVKINNSSENSETTKWWHDLGIVYKKNGLQIVKEYIPNWKKINGIISYDKIIVENNDSELELEPTTDTIITLLNNDNIYKDGLILDDKNLPIQGLVFVKHLIKPSENNEDVEVETCTGFFYYDYTESSWAYLDSWDSLTIEKSEAVVKVDPFSWDDSHAGNIIYPLKDDINPIFTFKTSELSLVDLTYDEQEAIGNCPWRDIQE